MRNILTQNHIKNIVQRNWFSYNTDFEQFLSPNNLQNTMKKFQIITRSDKWNNLEKKASVLIPICRVEQEISILYTLRKVGLRRHGGQVCFPGGMRDYNESPEETAIRETEEEVGVLKHNIKIYGCGSSVSRRGVLITPVIGYIGHIEPLKLKISEKEVQHAFALPLSKFCDLNNCKYTKFRSGYTLPVFLIDGYKVWGITAYLTHLFLISLLDDVYKFKLK